MVATDDKQNIVWQANLTDNGYANISKQDITLNLRGSNQYYDKESILHYNIHRYFDLNRNQYPTPDPLGLTAGDDLYAFAHNRLHEYVDLWGLAPEIYEDWYSQAPYLERAILGILVHYELTQIVRNSPTVGYGANDSYNGTFGILRPDIYHKNDRIVWELKPASW